MRLQIVRLVLGATLALAACSNSTEPAATAELAEPAAMATTSTSEVPATARVVPTTSTTQPTTTTTLPRFSGHLSLDRLPYGVDEANYLGWAPGSFGSSIDVVALRSGDTWQLVSLRPAYEGSEFVSFQYRAGFGDPGDLEASPQTLYCDEGRSLQVGTSPTFGVEWEQETAWGALVFDHRCVAGTITASYVTSFTPSLWDLEEYCVEWWWDETMSPPPLGECASWAQEVQWEMTQDVELTATTEIVPLARTMPSGGHVVDVVALPPGAQPAACLGTYWFGAADGSIGWAWDFLSPVSAAKPCSAAPISTVASDGSPFESLQAYHSAVNDGRLEAAFFGYMSDEQRAKSSIESFEEAMATTTVDDLTLLGSPIIAGDEATLTVVFTSRQAASLGPNGQNCSRWTLEYTMRFTDRWRIDGATNVGDSPTAC